MLNTWWWQKHKQLFFFSSPLNLLVLYSGAKKRKEGKPLGKWYSLELWSFVLHPHHSTFKFASIYLE